VGDILVLAERYRNEGADEVVFYDITASPEGRSVDRNWVKPYYNFTLSTSYRLDVGNLRKFEIRGTINNLFDKDPPFSGGGTLSGASANYHDTFGRSFRLGLSMDF
jgi:outer membrane receptor protein involved in Fe transport